MDKSQNKPIEVKLQLLKVQEIGCSINTNVLASVKNFDFNKIKMEFGFKSSYILKENFFNLSVLVKYHYNINNESTLLLELLTENHFKILNLENLIEENKNKTFKDKAKLIPILFGISVNTLRGMLVVKTAGTILGNFPLPLVNTNEILKSLINKKVD